MNPNPSGSSKPQDHSSHPPPPPPPHSTEYAPYPKLDPKDITPPLPTAAETWTSVPVGSDPPATNTTIPTAATAESLSKQHQEPATSNTPRFPTAPEGPTAPISGSSATTMPAESNPYVSSGPSHGPDASVKNICVAVDGQVAVLNENVEMVRRRKRRGRCFQGLEEIPEEREGEVELELEGDSGGGYCYCCDECNGTGMIAGR